MTPDPHAGVPDHPQTPDGKRLYDPGCWMCREVTAQGAFLAAEVGQVRYGKNGRPLQPSSLISICTQPDDSLPELLRLLARLFEQEEPVVIDDMAGGGS